jgi:hypothetical protein
VERSARIRSVSIDPIQQRRLKYEILHESRMDAMVGGAVLPKRRRASCTAAAEKVAFLQPSVTDGADRRIEVKDTALWMVWNVKTSHL